MTKLEEKLIELKFECGVEIYEYFTKQTIKRYSKKYGDEIFGYIFVCEGKIIKIIGTSIVEMQKDLEELKNVKS